MKKERIEWVDYTKAFACFLVALGHLLMSLKNIDTHSGLTDFIIYFIYLFHMPLFMCMSGFLYHAKSKVDSIEKYKSFILKKTVNLMIPYLFFYLITIALNMLFSSEVNNPVNDKQIIGIINNPIAPYWFLYALLSIFIVIPIFERIFKNNKNMIMIFFVILKVISLFYSPSLYFLRAIISYGIYFYLGIYIKCEPKIGKSFCKYLWFVLYLCISILIYKLKYAISNDLLNLIDVALAIIGTIVVINIFKTIKKSIILDSFKRYTFQIFLMHTIFAAGIRIIMYKFEINNYIIHLMIGILASIYLPVLVSLLSNKLKFTNFFFYPLNTIEEYRKGKKI